MTTRRSVDLGVPPVPRQAEAPLPANVREFPLVMRPEVVLETVQQQRERETKKAAARHERRKRLRSKGRPTHRERGRKAGDGGVSEMVVVYAGGAEPRAFSLRVDGRGVGADDFLGIEEGHVPEDPASIFGHMVRFGADPAKARRFLIHFKADMEERRLEGGLLSRSGAFGSADHSGEVGKAYFGVIGHKDPGSLTVGPLRVFCNLRCAAEAGHGRAQPIDRRGSDGTVDETDECFWCGASLWRNVR